MKVDIEKLISKCGFYCGSCPTYVNGECEGCRKQHTAGDCYTFDCVDSKGLVYCEQCIDFPCDDIITKDKATVLDTRWLLWKRSEK